MGWVTPVLAAVAVLSVGYAVWAHFARLRFTLLPPIVSGVVLAGMLGMSVVDTGRPADVASTPPGPPAGEASAPPSAPPPAASFAAGLGVLTPDSALSEYLPYFAAGGAVKREALARARLLPNRQDDAVSLLRQGRLAGLEDLARLDLAPTLALCRAFAGLLAGEADHARRQGSWAVADALEPHLETINWLQEAGCDLAAALHAVGAAAAAAPASPERARFLLAVDALLSPAPLPPADPAACLSLEVSRSQRIADCTAIIRTGRASLRRLAAIAVSRGNARHADGDDAGAVADYTAALALAPEDTLAAAKVLSNRGNALEAAGDHDAALRDFNAAIADDPGFAMALNNRGVAFEAHGEHDRALADFTRAVLIDPTYAGAFASRGRAAFFAGRFAEAARDMERASALHPADGYARLWRMLAAWRAPRAVAGDDTEPGGSLWPWPLVAVYRGEHDAAWAEEAAGQGDASERERHACDAAFYIGEQSLASGARARARALLQQAAARCPQHSVEGAAARAELARVGT